ncbi:Asp-tRNA(Asn)/Glu-tRNA(Gln) amidotransferase subunit GatC [Candidatus Roizmanbacteria bacterium]|nr:MAG: Asp-tRNA(Asn)/Glu-tRNA(Gln) amidotransferase subunit GatC [Candidatus Roizmanbacteria bacterium]
MSKTGDLTKKDVLHIAKLANLQIQDANIEMYRTQLEETINYVENLDELDTTNVEPTSHSTRLSNIYFEDGTKNSRQFTQKEALQNAKSTKKSMFVVKRIME